MDRARVVRIEKDTRNLQGEEGDRHPVLPVVRTLAGPPRDIASHSEERLFTIAKCVTDRLDSRYRDEMLSDNRDFEGVNAIDHLCAAIRTSLRALDGVVVGIGLDVVIEVTKGGASLAKLLGASDGSCPRQAPQMAQFPK
jgi:hypothetical protein